MSCIIRQPDEEAYADCAAILHGGSLVAFPTETVYGLGADAYNDKAVAEIYEAKGRPSFNPLIVHIANINIANRYALITPLARKLAETFWPGPLTLVMERQKNCPLSLLVSAGLDSVALRIPAHPIAQALLKKTNLPIAAPSANRSGRISPTLARHVVEEFQNKDFPLPVLDGGACTIGLESTVVDVRGDIPILLRPGSITSKEIANVCGILPILPHTETGIFHSPGMLASHYAPDRKLRLNAENPAPDEAFIGFGKMDCTFNLSPSGDLKEAAANLFRMLRLADSPPYTKIAVASIPETGLGIAINDRLQRAAAEK